MKKFYKPLAGILLLAIGLGTWFTAKDRAVPAARSVSQITSAKRPVETKEEIAINDPVMAGISVKGNLSSRPQSLLEKIKAEREQYRLFLRDHPFNNRARENHSPDEDKNEEEGKRRGDRPDMAWEQDFLRTMDPKLKRPTPEVLSAIIQNNISTASLQKRENGLPGTATAPWVERGPNNVGGRTRGLAWDPNDASGKKVWAGGVLGGLWYNNDITDANSAWVRVDDFWSNLSISCISFDPNNKQIAYVGTGESVNSGSGNTSGGTIGAGIWKTTDGGVSWAQIVSSANFAAITSLIVRNEAGTSVIYAGVDGFNGNGTFFGSASAGLQRSTNGGTNWTQVLPLVSTVNPVASSISIGSGNRIWVGTKASPYSATNRGGGRVYYSDNGTSWTLSDAVTVNNNSAGRVTVAPSPSDPNVVYSFVENNSVLSALRKTTNAGVTWGNISSPVDADKGIPAADFTRGQAWYDQVMSVDPNNPNTVIVGAVNLFLSTDGGTKWSQISKWSENEKMDSLSCSIVHADQHVIAFKPGSSSTVIFGNDGGVFYTGSLSTAATAKSISSRIKNYNVTQFYSIAMFPDAGSNVFMAGAQDNGTQKFTSPGLSATEEVYGGDGAFCFIDQQNKNIAIFSYVNNNFYYTNDGGVTAKTLISDDNTGSFINPAAYDNNLHILYTYKSAGALYRAKNLTGTPSISTITINELTEAATAFKVSPYTTTSTTLFVGTSAGNLLKITNADGTPVTKDISSTLPVGSISCVEIGANENELLVTYFNYGINKIMYSSDGGATWTSKMGNFPNIPVRWALFNPTLPGNEVILATQLGIYGTTNFSNVAPTWTQVNNGFANVRADMLQLRSSDNLVGVATHGRGLFTSTGFNASGAPSPPTITSFTPTSAGTGATVTITGTNFANATAVSFGGTAAGSFTVLSSTTVVAKVGDGNTGNVTVSTASGTAAKTGFTYLIGAPTITSFTPTTAGLSSTVTINGGNLSGTSVVKFGNITATSFTVVSNSQVTAVVGGGASGNVSLTTAGGTVSSTGFIFVPTPTITAFAPSSGGAGAIITLTGTNFSNATNVSFGGTAAAAFTVTSATDITAQVAAGSTGDVTVTTAGGTAQRAGFTYSTGGPPVITSFAPTAGAVGSTITITGSNFNPVAANNFVYFGAVRATVIGVSTTTITATIPTGASYNSISVTDKSTGLTAYSTKPFTVTFRTKRSIFSRDIETKVDFTTALNPNGFAIGDIDGDGKLDIVVANSNDNSISFFRNTAVSGTINSSSLAARVDFSTGLRPNHVAIGDLDGDGKLDVIVSTQNSTTLSIFRNTATAGVIDATSFAARVDLSVGFTGSRFVAINDLDMDGKADIIVTNGSRNTVSVFRNTSTQGRILASSFSSRVDYSTGPIPTTIAVNDIDGDNKPDLLIANSSSGNRTISILRNQSTSGSITASSFAAKVDLTTSVGTPVGVTIMDINADNKPEPITVMNSTGSNVNYFINNLTTTGTIAAANFSNVTSASGGTGINPTYIVTEDIDGDGVPDLVIANGNSALVTVFRNATTPGAVITASGSFPFRADLVTGNSPLSALAGDIDGDGKSDIVSLNNISGTLSVFRNNPLYPPSVTSFTPTAAAFGSVITITGTDFSNVLSVTFGGISAASFQVLSSTTIVAVVGTATSGAVSVTTSYGSAGVSGFTYYPKPTITAFAPISAAAGGTITISGTEFSNVLSVTFGGVAAKAFTATSVTDITATLSTGNSGAISVTTLGGTGGIPGFIFCPAPVVTAGGLTVVCAGTDVQLTSSILSSATTPTYQWFKDGNLIANATAVSYPASVTGTYTVVVNTSNNCSAVSNGIAVQVNPLPPTPVISAAAITIVCAGQTVALTSSAASGNQWFKDGSPITGSTGISLAAASSGTYSVKTTLATSCSATSAGFSVTVNPSPTAPSISASGPLVFCDTGKVVLTSSIGAGPNQWYKDNVAITGATAVTYTANTSGIYKVQTTNSNQCSSFSPNTQVTVNAIPGKPVITRNSIDLESSFSTGNQWYNDTATIANATGQAFRPSNNGYYKVRNTNAGCTGPFSDPYYYLVTAVLNISGNTPGSYTLLPNPVSDRLWIEAINPVNKVKVQIMDALGRVVLTKEFKTNILINMSAFNKGMYSVLLTDLKTRKQEAKQIVKQ